jgi:hypothetical protein
MEHEGWEGVCVTVNRQFSKTHHPLRMYEEQRSPVLYPSPFLFGFKVHKLFSKFNVVHMNCNCATYIEALSLFDLTVV